MASQYSKSPWAVVIRGASLTGAAAIWLSGVALAIILLFAVLELVIWAAFIGNPLAILFWLVLSSVLAAGTLLWWRRLRPWAARLVRPGASVGPFGAAED